MANIPPVIQFPAGLPTQDPALAGYLSQFSQSVYQWSVTVSNALTPFYSALPVPSGNSGGVPFYNSSTSVTSSAPLAAGQVVVGGGPGAPPKTISFVAGQVVVGSGSNAPPTTIANGQLPATATNDNAAPGKVGEYISSAVSFNSPIAIISDSFTSVTSIVITPGDWDVSGWVGFKPGSNVVATNQFCGFNTTPATIPPLDGSFSVSKNPDTTTPSNASILSLSTQRFLVSTNTTIYLIGYSIYSGGDNTMSLYGFIGARRAR